MASARTVFLKCGEVTIALDGNALTLSREERDFVCSLLNLCDAYERENPAAAIAEAAAATKAVPIE